MDCLNKNPLTICDTGHNVDGISEIVAQIEELQFDKLHFVLGMVNDKSIESILNILPKNAIYYFCKANIPRGLDQHQLKQMAQKMNLNGKAFNSVHNAYEAAKQQAKSNDLIFIGGSTFVVAEVL